MSGIVKRHCMVVHAYYPIGEPRVQRETEALIDNNYQVDIICLRQPGEENRANVRGANVYRLAMRRYKGKGVFIQFLEYLAFFFLAFWQLTILQFKRRYQVVQLHNPPDFLVFAALIPRLMGAKVILDLHDLTPEFYASRFKTNMDAAPVKLVRWQEYLACRFANCVITVTEPWRQALVERGLPPEKSDVVMNLADNKIFQQDTKLTPHNNEGQFTLFYHGALTQRYGIDMILHAVDQLRNELPDIAAIIHGRGDFSPQLQQLAKDLQIEEYVQFSTEYMPMEDLPALIAQADLAIIPYQQDIFTDGILPTKLMEYTAMGVPAVVSRTAATQAYFDETMVQFFTPGELDDMIGCIKTLYNNRQRLTQLANNARQFNRKYNWQTQSEHYVQLIKQLGTR